MIKLILIYLLFVIFGVVLQSSAMSEFSILKYRPDLLLILTIVSALKMNKTQAVVSAFMVGLISDFSSGHIVGPQAAGHVIACMVTQSFSKNVYANRLFSLALMMAGAVVIKEIITNILINFFVPKDIFLDRFYFVIRTLPLEVVLTAAIAPFFIRLLSKKVTTYN